MLLKIHIATDEKLKNLEKVDDMLLIKEIKQGNSDVLQILFNRYSHLVFASCMKYLRDENLAKDSTMAIFESLEAKIVKHEISYLKSWLFTTVKNHCLMILRKNSKIRFVEYGEQIRTESDEIILEHPKSNQEKKYNILLNCLSELKQEQKVCLELMYLQNYCYNSIAEATGYNLKKVKSYIQNGKRSLKIMLEGYNEFIIEPY